MQRVVPVETFALFWGKGPKQYPRYGNRMTQVHKDPNILTIDNFLTSADINDLHNEIRGRRFRRSSMKDRWGRKVVCPRRTSRTIMLPKSQSEVTRRIEARAAAIVGVSVANIEPLQIVSYIGSQHFKLHHDAGTLIGDRDNRDVVIPSHRAPRIFTIFCYLTTTAKGIGCTFFNDLCPPLSVQPRKGSALLFANFTSGGHPDIRVSHSAQPLLRGHRKLGLNIWISDRSQICGSRT